MTLAVSRRSLLSHASAAWSSKAAGSKDVLGALEAAAAVGTCTVSSAPGPGGPGAAAALAAFRRRLAGEPRDLPWEELASAAAAAKAAAGEERGGAAAAAAAAAPSSSSGPPPPLATHRAKGRSFSIYLAKLSTAGPRLRAIHARLSSLLTLYIDAASSIDAGDGGWDMLLAVEDGDKKAIAGMATLFSMYGFPDRTRLRVCQVSVLPPCQKLGLGMALAEAAFRVADERKCLDVTVRFPPFFLFFVFGSFFRPCFSLASFDSPRKKRNSTLPAKKKSSSRTPPTRCRECGSASRPRGPPLCRGCAPSRTRPRRPRRRERQPRRRERRRQRARRGKERRPRRHQQPLLPPPLLSDTTPRCSLRPTPPAPATSSASRGSRCPWPSRRCWHCGSASTRRRSRRRCGRG